MTAFTIFFCGTGSNSYDFANTNYVAGELISTLAMNHGGHEFVDWIIVDGPGSGNIQEAQKWVPSGNYSKIRGKLEGKGWEENVQHAVAMLIGRDPEERTEQTSSEVKILRKAGVGVDQVQRTGTIGRTLLGATRKVEYDLHPRISPQALQEQKIKIMRRSRPITHVNVIGWSRGGITCHMFANALAQTRHFSHIPVNIFACDPVPGSGGSAPHRVRLQSNVAWYVGIYAADERSRGFSPVLPSLAGNTQHFITTMPGRHGTLVGNAAIDGSGGMNTFFGPGRVTRDLAESFLRAWGTNLNKALNLPDIQILTYYDEMMAQAPGYRAMHDVSYTKFTQGSDRAVEIGDGTWKTFGSSATLSAETVFVNLHHRWLFERNHGLLYSGLFSNRLLSSNQVAVEMARVAFRYPTLHQRLRKIPIGTTG